MTSSPARSTTKARAALLAYVLEGARSARGLALGAELAAWADAREQFEAFLAAYDDKVRKKLRVAGDDDALLDVRAELLVAALLCGDRRFAVEFEAYGRGKRGPDLTVVFRQNLRFNVEVTRQRPWSSAVATRLQGALLAKLRQLPAGLPNALALVTGEGVAVAAEDVATAAKHLKQLADRKEEAVFVRRGYESARDFLGYFARLSGVLMVADAPAEVTFWGNPQARHPLPRDLVAALVRCASSNET
jgi:hypothetical protein